jgi:hypothetical protein
LSFVKDVKLRFISSSPIYCKLMHLGMEGALKFFNATTVTATVPYVRK